MNTRITPDNIQSLKSNEVFVFGSNLAGRHGKGAAKRALKWGAKYGKGIGLCGNTYAIPTKDERLKALSIKEIRPFVEQYIELCEGNYHIIFLTTEIGCGLAGFTPEQIAPLFKEAIELENVCLPKRFWDILNK